MNLILRLEKWLATPENPQSLRYAYQRDSNLLFMVMCFGVTAFLLPYVPLLGLVAFGGFIWFWLNALELDIKYLRARFSSSATAESTDHP